MRHKLCSASNDEPRPASPLLLTVREVANELNISIRTVWRLLASGDLEQVKIGRAVRVPRSSVTDLVQRGGTV